MPDLSVIIPARKEQWLLQTVQSIRAAIRGDTEILVVIDGLLQDGPPLPEQWPAGPPVRVIVNRTPLGQRQSINQAARLSEAKFLLKTDAHSFLDEGFDVKLMADCEHDWTVIPRMYNLHSHDMVCRHCGERYYNRPPMDRCEKCDSREIGHRPAMMREVTWERKLKKPPTDFMYFRAPTCDDMALRVQYWDGPTQREFPHEHRTFKRWAKRQPEIADVMTGQGACFFLHRERFWELGGMDEAHGHWGQMGVELACKSWLSGGRQVVNRKTWFAHLFRCGGSEGCPWPMDGRQQEAARQYSIDLWSNNKWLGQKRPLEWLVDKFWPVPTWQKPDPTKIHVFIESHVGGIGTTTNTTPCIVPEDMRLDDTGPTLADCQSRGVPRATDHDLTVLYYTDGSLPQDFGFAVSDWLKMVAAKGLPIVWQEQPADWSRDHAGIYANILAGLAKVTTPYVALAEHDVLYPERYFDHRPTHEIEYNTHRWILHADKGLFSRRGGTALSQCFARTDALRAAISAKLGEMLPPHKAEPVGATFKAPVPTIDISGHGGNLTGPKGVRGKTRERVKPWGTAAEVMERFCVPKISTTETQRTQRNTQSIPPLGDLRASVVKVSVLIPARNEPYLDATVRDLLQNLRLDFEILVGVDGPDQPPLEIDDGRIRVIRSAERIGMRPLINRLAREARGEYLLRMDAHCMIAEGLDAALVGLCEREGHVTAVAKRYELDPRRWQRRERTDTPCRRLTHESEDGCGLRSLPWPEYDQAHADEEISETMTCSGSSWTCKRSTFIDWWGGFDERHGTFGQEGCEISCMTWLSGGRFLVHKGTWYAHWNRNKATYALGASVKPQSIEWSNKLWRGNLWPYQRYGFDWLIDKFKPPGWESEISNLKSQISNRHIAAVEQRSLVKTRKRLRVDHLWEARDAIADPGKRYRLQIFWRAYAEFVQSVLDGKPSMDGQYYRYLLGHVTRDPVHQPTQSETRKVEKSLADSIRLIESVKANGLLAPLEFYIGDGRMVLWKGYRRLVIARALGIERVVGRCFADRRAAGVLSPQANLTRLQAPVVNDVHRLGEQQFRKWGHGATDKYFTHNYTRYYDQHLHAIRKRVKKVLELGLLNGASLALWRDYFPRAEILGVDIEPERWKKFAGDLPNTRVLVGSETDPAFMVEVARQGPFDLIVDDASHDPLLQRKAFEALWPAVRQYGYYVIEDTFRGYDGGEQDKPPGLPLGFESRIYQQRDVLAIYHHYNISFVQKA